MRGSNRWTAAYDRAMKYDIFINGARRSVTFTEPGDEPSRMTALIDGRSVEADAARISPGVYSILLQGHSVEVTVEEAAGSLLVYAAGREFRVEITDPRSWRRKRGGSIELEGQQQVAAPMPGKIVSVLVAPGQKVEAGQGLLVIEAMKMQNEIRSPKSGVLEKLLAREGQTVGAGEIVAIVT
jgi:biotin carboxyl carrier protein